MPNELRKAFLRAARGTWKYGYFAPLTAVWLAIMRPGGYLRHLRALYLFFWRGKMYPKRQCIMAIGLLPHFLGPVFVATVHEPLA